MHKLMCLITNEIGNTVPYKTMACFHYRAEYETFCQRFIYDFLSFFGVQAVFPCQTAYLAEHIVLQVYNTLVVGNHGRLLFVDELSGIDKIIQDCFDQINQKNYEQGFRPSHDYL